MIQFLKIGQYFFSPYKWEIPFIAFIMFTAGLLEALNLLVLYPLINYGLEQNSKGLILEFFDQLIVFFQTENTFIFYCYLLVIVTVITGIFKFYSQFLGFSL